MYLNKISIHLPQLLRRSGQQTASSIPQLTAVVCFGLSRLQPAKRAKAVLAVGFWEYALQGDSFKLFCYYLFSIIVLRKIDMFQIVMHLGHSGGKSKQRQLASYLKSTLCSLDPPLWNRRASLGTPRRRGNNMSLSQLTAAPEPCRRHRSDVGFFLRASPLLLDQGRYRLTMTGRVESSGASWDFVSWDSIFCLIQIWDVLGIMPSFREKIGSQGRQWLA